MLRTGPAARNGPGEKATSRRRTLWWRNNDATEPSGQYIRRSNRDWRRQSRCRTVLRARNDDMESCRPNLSTPTTTDACGPRKERASRCILYTPRPTRCGIARKIQNERSIRGSDPMIVVPDWRNCPSCGWRPRRPVAPSVRAGVRDAASPAGAHMVAPPARSRRDEPPATRPRRTCTHIGRSGNSTG